MSDDTGKTDTKAEEPKKDVNAAGGSSDGLIGNRRIRTFIIGGLLIAYSFFFWSYFGGGTIYNILLAIAQATVFVCCIIIIILHCLKKDGGIETIVGWILTIAAVVLIIVTILQVIPQLQFNITYLFIGLGQGLLPGCTALFLGLDTVKDFMANENRRLFANLLALGIASGAASIFWWDTLPLWQLFGLGGGATMLAIGYDIVCVCCVIYLILFVCSCCTCGCKDNCIVRLLLSGGLIAGGALVGIGYFIFIGAFGAGFIGYAILVVGLCITWALDMGIVDSVKNAKGGGN